MLAIYLPCWLSTWLTVYSACCQKLILLIRKNTLKCKYYNYQHKSECVTYLNIVVLISMTEQCRSWRRVEERATFTFSPHAKTHHLLNTANDAVVAIAMHDGATHTTNKHCSRSKSPKIEMFPCSMHMFSISELKTSLYFLACFYSPLIIQKIIVYRGASFFILNPPLIYPKLDRTEEPGY